MHKSNSLNVSEKTQSADIIFNIENLSIKSYDEELKIAKKLHSRVGQKLVKPSCRKDEEILKLLDDIEKTVKCV